MWKMRLRETVQINEFYKLSGNFQEINSFAGNVVAFVVSSLFINKLCCLGRVYVEDICSSYGYLNK